MFLKYVNEKNSYEVAFKKVSPHIVQITSADEFPVKTKGFICFRDGVEDDEWDYKRFKTVYRRIEGGVQFSDDGSVYVAPPEPEPIPEPEPYVPTLEEIKIGKKQEIESMYQISRLGGIDVELSTGIQHFALSGEDLTFLSGKQIELSTGVTEVSYQDANNRCMMLSAVDMQKVITEAFTFVDMQTTYRNNLYEWVDECKNTEEVSAIAYGADIPFEYQNEVYKRKLELLTDAQSDKVEG